MGEFLKSWAGECSAWECDGLGHLNMRHYMTKVMQGRQMFFIRAGLHEAFKSDAFSTIRVTDFHIKYLGEARPDNPLYIETGLLELGETTARICHMMFHGDGRIAATIVENIEHISLRTKAAFPWPKRFEAAVVPFQVDQPQPSKPRNLSYDTVPWKPREADIKKLTAKHIGSGVFQPFEIGVDGAVTPQAFMGRTTETISHMMDGYPEFLDADYHASGKSGALLEAQMFIHRRAEAGDGYHFYSGVAEGNAYTRKLVHHLFDVVTGDCIFSMIGDGCLFDLKARKLIKASDAQVALLQKNVVKGLRV
ncbi:MAG: thioesterase family protein [Hellea sp.]